MNASKRVSNSMYGWILFGACAITLGPLAAPLFGPGSGNLQASIGQTGDPLAVHDSASKQLLDIAANAGSVDVFGRVIQAANDANLLQVDGPFTVFMPMNEAFSAMTGEQLSSLLNDSDALRSFVKTYIVPGHVSATDLMAEKTVVSLAGEQIAARVGSEIQVNDANVIATEVAQNGVVHYVDRLL